LLVPTALPWWRIAAPLLVFALLALICWLRPLPLLRIILLASVAMIIYASCQDQVSARLASEYFTIGHPPIPGLSDPALLGLVWGFLGGFPGGIMLGIPVAMVARFGPLPQLAARQLIRPLLFFLAGVAAMTLVAGLSGWYNAEVVNIAIGAPWDAAIPPERHRRFFIVACAHFGTYLGGVILGLGLCGWILRQRYQLDRDKRR
jgi:hypothetical protein